MAGEKIVGFGPKTARRIYALVNPGPFSRVTHPDREWSSEVEQWLKIGVADGDIPPGGSQTISIWREGVDTGDDETAVLDWLSDEPISENKQVLIAYFQDESLWRVIGAECEDEEPPNLFQAVSQSQTQTLTTDFEQIAGMTLAYSSGTAIEPVQP